MHIYLLTGTPRSGLNLLSNCLNILGIKPLDEHSEIKASTINDLLLQDLGLSPYTPSLPKDWLQSTAATRAKDRIHKLLTTESQLTINDSQLTYISLNNPLTLSLWQSVLNEANIEPKYICILRHPFEVAMSLEANEGIDRSKSHIFWLAHSRAAQRQITSQLTNSCLITFDQLLADPVSTLGTRLSSSTSSLLTPYSSLIDYVQPSLKNHHISDFPETEAETYKPYVRLYEQIRAQHISKGKISEIREDSWETNSSDLIDSLLQSLSQDASRLPQGSTQLTNNYSQLTANITFPSSKHESGITHTIPLIEDQWQKIEQAVPEPELLGNKSILLKPIDGKGFLKISSVCFRNSSTGSFFWSTQNVRDLYRLPLYGSAVHIRDKENLSILVTNSQFHLNVPSLSTITDIPLILEIWIKPSRSQDFIQAKQILPTTFDGYQNQSSTPKTKVIVCTHHKAGTNFLMKSFRSIANFFNLTLWYKFYDNEPSSWDICFHQHSRAREIFLSKYFRGLHCVRHPKALIYSAALYHERCDETWVDIPLERFTSHTFWAASTRDNYNIIKDPSVSGEQKYRIMHDDYSKEVHEGFKYFDSGYNLGGKTYREYLKSLPTIEEKLIFEMNAYSRGVIYDMLNFPSDKRFIQIKLEDISYDQSMLDLAFAYYHLGFNGQSLQKCLDFSEKNCLWKVGTDSFKKHVTTGMSEEWNAYFIGEVANEYRRLFGWAEQALGYEH